MSSSHLCMNGCGFFGSPATFNLCSKCYQGDSKQQPLIMALSKLSINTSTTRSSITSSSDHECVGGGTEKDRCSSCRKRVRVRVMGFKCRCGNTFCSLHRYAEEHGCPFDYKGTARNAIGKANPCIKADKLERSKFCQFS